MNTETSNTEIKARHSVVDPHYKIKYAERAEHLKGKRGLNRKVIARSCGDWLALELAASYLTTELYTDEEGREHTRQALNVPAFEAMLDANGIKHQGWNRTTAGWQGRLRMTGRLALQRVVAESGELRHSDGRTVKAPMSWCAKIAR